MSTAIAELARAVRDLRARVAELEGMPVAAKPAYRRILHLVSQDFGVPEALLASPARRADVALARHVAFHVAHHSLGYSMPRIGRLADRDHSSVCHGIHRIAAMCVAYPEFAARVAAITTQIDHEGGRA
jgi:chromosomal replication initiation ATPase DnaA